MTALWIGGALLLLVCLLCVAWPILRARRWKSEPAAGGDEHRAEENLALYREHLSELEADRDAGRIDDEQFHRLETELQRNLLDDQQEATKFTFSQSGRWALAGVAVVFALGSVYLYIARGNAADVLFARMQDELIQSDVEQLRQGVQVGPERTRQLVEAVEQRLKVRPDNTRYWYLLGIYTSRIGNFDRALTAFERVYEAAPNEPGNASQLAQAIFMSNGNRITDRIESLVERALAMNEQDPTALGLAGIAAFGDRRFGDAASYWQRAVDQMPQGASGRQALMAGIERARAQSGQAANSADGESDSEWRIPVQISLAEGMTPPEGATLFVFARQHQGSPMPLVVTRRQVRDFPATIVLDETMAMTTKDRLTQTGQIEIVARLSQSGSVRKTTGDLEGAEGPFDPAELPETVELTIDTRLP